MNIIQVGGMHHDAPLRSSHHGMISSGGSGGRGSVGEGIAVGTAAVGLTLLWGAAITSMIRLKSPPSFVYFSTLTKTLLLINLEARKSAAGSNSPASAARDHLYSFDF